MLEAGLNIAGIAMVMELQDENTQLRAEKEGHQRLQTVSIPASRSRKRTSSSRKPSTRRRPTTNRLWFLARHPSNLDEADRWEQHMPVPAGEDDYPHDRFEPGWS
jgi:hypothetical protein